MSLCLVCSDNFIVNAKAIQCRYCQTQFHSHCVKQKDTTQKALQESSGLFWFCEKCVPIVMEKLSSRVVGSPNSQRESTTTVSSCEGGEMGQRADIESIVNQIVGARVAELQMEHTTLRDELQECSSGLKNEMRVLRESNVDLVRLLTSGGGAIPPGRAVHAGAPAIAGASSSVTGAVSGQQRRTTEGGRGTKSGFTNGPTAPNQIPLGRERVPLQQKLVTDGGLAETSSIENRQRGSAKNQHSGGSTSTATTQGRAALRENFGTREVSQRNGGLSHYGERHGNHGAVHFRGDGDREGYELVTGRRRKVVYGTGAGFEGDGLKAYLPMTNIHVSKLSLEVTKEVVFDYLKRRLPDVEVELQELEVNSGAYKSFKVSAPANYKQTLLDPSFWPRHVAIKPFWEHNFRKRELQARKM